jgi:predicted membrane channel-forming protein YqfA (hemolysin III family)
MLTTQDVLFVKEKVLPKNRRMLAFVAFILFAISVVVPFLPTGGKFSRSSPSAYESGNFVFAFGVALLIFGLIWFSLYYKDIICVKRDLRQGKKVILRLALLRKNKISGSRYELILANSSKGKTKISEKITIEKGEFYQWVKGDIVEVGLLPEGGTILHYQNLNKQL